MSNPNVALISTPEEMSQAWFKASVQFIKGLDDEDDTIFQVDGCGDRSIEQNNGMYGDTEVVTFVDGVVSRSVFDGAGVVDSQSDDLDGVLDSQTKDVNEQVATLPIMSSNSPQAGNASLSEFFAEFGALKKEVLLIKRRKDDEFDELSKRFSKLEKSETFANFKKLLSNDISTDNASSDSQKKIRTVACLLKRHQTFLPILMIL